MDAKPKRRWLRFSLRTLMLLVTVASAGFGWLGLKVRQAQRQKDAVEAIQKPGGRCHYDYQFDSDNQAIISATPPGPALLRNSFGVDFLTNVVRVEFSEGGVNDAGLVYLDGLNQLKYLCLRNTNTTDAGLVQLQRLNQLRLLHLEGTQVTDAGLVHLQGLTKLKQLWLLDTQVTDAGVEQLQKALPNLEITR